MLVYYFCEITLELVETKPIKPRHRSLVLSPEEGIPMIYRGKR